MVVLPEVIPNDIILKYKHMRISSTQGKSVFTVGNPIILTYLAVSKQLNEVDRGISPELDTELRDAQIKGWRIQRSIILAAIL